MPAQRDGCLQAPLKTRNEGTGDTLAILFAVPLARRLTCLVRPSKLGKGYRSTVSAGPTGRGTTSCGDAARMAILVICTGCKARFSVDEKFAGKQGPCPKCKVAIRIPSPDDVKIEEPEEYAAGGKDKQGRPVVKPIEREPSKLTPAALSVAVGGAVATLAVSALAGSTIRQSIPLLALGALLLAVPMAAAAYSMLREPELEPFRGAALWLRAAGCGAVYAALWGVFAWLPADWIGGDAWMWLLLAPPFLAVGGFTALATFDLDFTSGVLHYGVYLMATIVLRWVVGLPALWAASAAIG